MKAMIRSIIHLLFLIFALFSGIILFAAIIYEVEKSYKHEITPDPCIEEALMSPNRSGRELLISHQLCVARENHINCVQDGVVYVWSLISTVGFGHKTVKTIWGKMLTYLCLPLMIFYKITEYCLGHVVVSYMGYNRRLSHRGFRFIMAILVVLMICHSIILLVFGHIDSYHSCIWFLVISSTTIGLGDEAPPAGGWLCFSTLVLLTFQIVFVALLFGYGEWRFRQYAVYHLGRLQTWIGKIFGIENLQDLDDDEMSPSYWGLPNSLQTGHTLAVDVNVPANFTASAMVPPGKMAELEDKITVLFQQYGVEVTVSMEEPTRSRSTSSQIAPLFFYGSSQRLQPVSENSENDDNSAAYSQEVTVTTFLKDEVPRKNHASLQKLFEWPETEL